MSHSLEEIAANDLAVISRPGRVRSLVQVICRRRAEAQKLVREFGGVARVLPRNWLEFAQKQEAHAPIRIGRRLEIVSEPARSSKVRNMPLLVIPAAGAFGTGEHATTAMSLRLLEEITRNRPTQLAIARRRNWHRRSRARCAASRRQRSSGTRQRSPSGRARAPERAAQSHFTDPLHCRGSAAMEAIRTLRSRHGQSLQRTADRCVADFPSCPPRQRLPHRFRHSARADRSGRARAPPKCVSGRETTATREMDRVSRRARKT